MSVDVGEGTRAQVFKEQIAEMKIPAPNPGRDKVMARLGGLLAAVGIALGVVGYFLSHGTENLLNQGDAQVLALLGVACSVTGAAVFLRYSLSQFLRLWLMRLIVEQRDAHSD
ncbi:hypothetical protein BH10ACT8_BH10ACT8_04270 [soil metagenome]|jgi:hypothetical protein